MILNKISDYEFRSSNTKPKIFFQRNDAIEIKCDLEKRLENPFMLSKKFINFNFNELIYIFKQNLYFNEKIVDIDQLEECLKFIIEKINPLVTMEIKYQKGALLLGPDDKYPIITNIFAGCFIGKNKININLFKYIEQQDFIHKYFGVNKELNPHYQIYLYVKHLAILAYNWLNDKSYIEQNKFDSIIEDNLKLKLTLLGNCNVGKTSFLQKYINPEYNISNVQTTITLDIVKKSVETNIFNRTFKLNIQFWDTAGLEKYNALSENYILNNDGIIYLFDLGCKKFQEYLENNINQNNLDIGIIIKKYHNDNIKFKNFIKDKPIIYFGNKTDLINIDYFKNYNISFLSKFLKQNYKYNKLVSQWLKNIDFMNLEHNILLKYIKLILNFGNIDKHYWGNVLSFEKINEVVNHSITDVSLNLLNTFDNDDEDIINISDKSVKKIYKFDCCNLS